MKGGYRVFCASRKIADTLWRDFLPGELDGLVALVTGGSKGIGAAICRELASQGAKVGVNYNTSEEAAEKVVAEIITAGGEAFAFKADISVPEQAEALVASVISHYGGLNILVNNAGITRDELILRMSLADWDAVNNTNLRGAFVVTKAAVRPLQKAKHARIIFISSIVGQTGNLGQVNYAAAKAGIIGMALALAKELARNNITVNAVSPGIIRTDMVHLMPPEATKTVNEHIPLVRDKKAADKLGEPGDVACAVVYLAGPGASYITGQVIRVDGGLLMG